MVVDQLIFQLEQAGIKVRRIPNFPIDSNCYLIQDSARQACILVDPAAGRGETLFAFLQDAQLSLQYIILTHEHFDHISSVEYLRMKFPCKVIASKICSENIRSPKKNLSLFHDQIGFACEHADILITNQDQSLVWNNLTLTFYLTPGHSEGSICFNISDHLFTGDIILKSYKVVTKLPGGNKKLLEKSLEFLFSRFNQNTHIFPGHGEPFRMREIKVQQLIN